MRSTKMPLSGFNNFPTKFCETISPTHYTTLSTINGPRIARGQGRSYNDCALLENGVVLQTDRLNRFLAFDKHQGVITAESGVTLKAALAITVPNGWFLPVTPGTQFASLGGCVAHDVHGKNHLQQGSFSQHIQQLKIITANQQTISCSAQTHPDIFWATVAGMGLTGIIGEITLKLLPIETSYLSVQHHAANHLEKLLLSFEEIAPKNQYTVAWLDALIAGEQFGRGVIFSANHAYRTELSNVLQKDPLNHKERFSWTLPCKFPSGIINSTTLHYFNQWYYRRNAAKIQPYFTHYRDYFYPLDTIHHWNRVYGKRGFIQYQCVFPKDVALLGIQQLLETLQTAHCSIALAVLKRFDSANQAPLSFAKPGYTLAIDIPIYDDLFVLLDHLDMIVTNHHGKIYLAKDARIKPDIFREMYPDYPAWLHIKKQLDPENFFRSNMSERLNIGEK